MKSGKQRRVEMMARREKRKKTAAILLAQACPMQLYTGLGATPVHRDALTSNSCCGLEYHPLVVRGFYLPIPFTCRNCDESQCWKAAQQKWWYEVVGGDIFTTATRCRPCRASERQRKQIARLVSVAGREAKIQRLNKEVLP